MESRPNVIFILADDLGWRDLGCYGSTFYETPNLDRLAEHGVRFTQAYAACPVCSPTRASLLTGKYPARVGVTNFIAHKAGVHPARGRLIDAPYIDHLPTNELNVARAFSQAGYATWHVGKWHLGEALYAPEKQGFDVNIGGCDWGSPKRGYFSPWGLPTLTDGPEGEFLDDRLTDEAIALIRGRGRRPFFLNLCYYLVHTPIQAKEELVQVYRRKAHEMGLDQIEALEPGERFPSQHKRSQRIMRRRVQSDPVYAAMVEILDTNVGRLLEALDEVGEAENTIVVFTSDNGGLSTSEGSPTCNAPLSEGKGWMYDGGIRAPLIVRWPAGATPGTVSDALVTSPDFYPTLLELADLPLNPEQHVDGKSFRSALKGRPYDRPPIFWHYPHYGNQGGTPCSCVRAGDYKLIEFFEDGHLELYNLRSDIKEEHNLVQLEPERVAEMKRMLSGWRDAIDAKIPDPNLNWTHS